LYEHIHWIWYKEAEPCIGFEFDTADAAREFYDSYAARTGFRSRSGQLYDRVLMAQFLQEGLCAQRRVFNFIRGVVILHL